MYSISVTMALAPVNATTPAWCHSPDESLNPNALTMAVERATLLIRSFITDKR